jgi:hypothetical protein
LRVTGSLTFEMNRALEAVVKMVQHENFDNEIKQLQKNGTLSNNHPLKSLNVMLIDGIVRVGGHLVNSRYKFDKRHQMLWPKDHEFTRMLVRDFIRDTCILDLKDC